MSAERAYRRLFDRAIRHRIDLDRLAASEIEEVLRFIREVEADALGSITAAQVRAARTMSRADRLRVDALESFLRDIRLIYAEAYQRMTSRILDGMDDLAAFEAEFATDSLRRALDDLGAAAGGAVEEGRLTGAGRILSPTVAQLQAVIRATPITVGADAAPLTAWLDGMSQAALGRVEGALKIGFIEGESVDQLRERLRPVWKLNERGAEAVIRTAVTHVAAEVAQLSYDVNPEIIHQVEWVSTLDSRTTPICRARDGKRYPLNSGPRPPAHIRCRSTVIPVLDDFPPPERLTYGEWLARQSADTQADILGPARARAFREGKLRIEQFVANDGRLLTLEELRARYPRAIPDDA